MRHRWIALGSSLALSAIALAQDLDPSVTVALSQLIGTMRAEYLHSSAQDWDALRERGLEAARTAPEGEAAHAAIEGVLEGIGNPAIFYNLWPGPAQTERRKQFGELGIRADGNTGIVYEVFERSAAQKFGVRVGDQITAIDGAPPKILGEHVYTTGQPVALSLERAGQTLEIRVPIFNLPGVIAPMHAGRLGKAAYLEPARENPEPRDQSRLSTALQFTLRTLETSGACGYVLDFRRVRSNLMASVSGFGPVLTTTNAPLFKVAHPDGTGNAIAYEPVTGSATWGSVTEGSLASRPWTPKRPDAPIAILTSPFNTSDLLPVAFQGRANTRFFGQARAVQPYDVHYQDFGDGGYVQFPAGVVLDRTGHEYDAPLEVNEVVPTDWAAFGTKRDAVIAAARTWLEAHPACR
jgi:hypothetical protein